MGLIKWGHYSLHARSPDILISMEVYVTHSYRKSPPGWTTAGNP